MFSRIRTFKSTGGSSDQTERLKRTLDQAEAVVIGAGAGLSASAGMTYSGERFERNFRDCFVLTTNVDHQFQLAGFDKRRLFYTQGDFGLWQCSGPCCRRTYDNEDAVRRMAAEQRDMKVPTELIPRCPECGRPMTMNLRTDDTFVEDAGWHSAAERYGEFLSRHRQGRVVYLELGVGGNTPVIIKYPFWKYTLENPEAVYACVNLGEVYAPKEIAERSVCVDGDIGEILERLL